MKKNFYSSPAIRLLLNKWDILALLIALLIIFVISWVCIDLGGSIDYKDASSLAKYEKISLNLWDLPYYAAHTSIRMFIALFFSLVFSFIVGYWAAKSKKAENIIIPMIDVLQSIPILGFLSITISGFLILFPHSLWGAQLSIVFALFTAQAWNITLSLYQSIRTVPKELREMTHIYQLSKWQLFWKLEIPFAIPGLIWNAMMSMSASWFMIVASESIVVHFSKYSSAVVNLPGIGSFINQANDSKNIVAILAAIIVMLIVIILYDQLIFRPVIKWSEKFIISEISKEGDTKSWFLVLLKRSKVLKLLGNLLLSSVHQIFNIKLNWIVKNKWIRLMSYRKDKKKLHSYFFSSITWKFFFIIIIMMFLYLIWKFIYSNYQNLIAIKEVWYIIFCGVITSIRVLFLIVISSIIWVPIGVWVGLRPKVAEKIQPYAQFFAAFPVNLLYGLLGTFVITFNLNFNLWCILLMALGTQWYIFFNVIAGTSAIPGELKMLSQNMQLKGYLKWTKFLFPAIFPFYITGAIAAAGGAWNASIICEYINWGENNIIMARGIGAYITEQYHKQGDHTLNIALGVVVMCILVLLTNKFFWRKIYSYAEKRFSMNM